jgi:peptidoglycan/LPS O-acetylase OafA/YrhL
VQLVSIGNFALTILLFSGSTEGLVSKILTGKLARKLGDISYSIYLWHALVFVIIVDIFQFVFGRETTGNGGLIDPVAAYAAIFLALGVTLYLSAVSYKLIEKPARDCSKRVIARYAEKRMAKQPDFSPAE